jgi:hypothetical protein
MTNNDAQPGAPIDDDSPSTPLAYRLLWTWDHSTNWRVDLPARQEYGAANSYFKPAEGFLEDYRRVVDYASRHQINGVVVYGLLRDDHGGIETAKELCRYANERGVRILPGVGINSYGGIYYDGRHQFSLRHWLLDHPNLRAKPPRDRRSLRAHDFYGDIACPSQPENRQWHADAIQWLSEEFEIGGINFETGDYGICQCELCESRRPGQSGETSIADMVDIYPSLFAAARRARPDAWLIAETYVDNILDAEAIAPLANLPPDTICQFTLNRAYWQQVKQEMTAEHVRRLPLKTNVIRTHMGSQWPFEKRERYRFVARDFADLARLCTRVGIDGMHIFGEVSPLETANEINYLAFTTFAADTAITWDAFVSDVLGPLLGGADLAADYVHILENPIAAHELDGAVRRARDQAASVTDDDQHRRWVWLMNRIYRERAMIQGWQTG